MWATKAANEQSEFLGSVSTALAEIETAIVENPGMSPEDLKKLKDNAFKTFDTAAELATMPQSQSFIKNFNLKNRELLERKIDTRIAEIVTQQELARFKLERERLIAERKPDELNTLYEGVSGKLLDAEVATLAFKNDILKIDALQVEIDKGEAIGDAFALWEQTVTEEDPDGNLNVAFDSIEADPRVPEGDKQEVESELKTRVANRRAETKLALEKQQEQDRDVINKMLFEEKNYDIYDVVNASSLDEKEQRNLLKLARQLIAEPPEGYKDDPVVMAQTLPKIARGEIVDPATELAPLVGKGMSPETYASIVKGDYFWKDFWFKRIDIYLKSQLGWDGAYEKFIHPEGGISYKLASDELFVAIETKKLKGKEIYDEGTLIAIPFIISYWENALMLEKPNIEKMKKMLLEGKVAPETKKPVKPEPVDMRDVLDPEGIF